MPFDPKMLESHLDSQDQTAQSNVIGTQGISADQAAQAIEDEKVTGIPATVGMYGQQNDTGLSTGEPTIPHPAVAAYAADPARAAATRDDWGPLSDLAHKIGAIPVVGDFLRPGAYAARDIVDAATKGFAEDEKFRQDHPVLSLIPGANPSFRKAAGGLFGLATAVPTGAANALYIQPLAKVEDLLPTPTGESPAEQHDRNVRDVGLSLFGLGVGKRVGNLTRGVEVPLGKARVVPDEPAPTDQKLLEGPKAPEPEVVFDEPPQPGSDPKADELWKAHAEATSKALEELEAATAATKLATRSPTALAEFVDGIAGDQTISMPMDKLQELWTNDPEFVKVWDNHLAGSLEYENDNVIMPLSTYLTHLQPWAAELNEHVAVGGGISQAEAKELSDPAKAEEDKTPALGEKFSVQAIEEHLASLPPEQLETLNASIASIWGQVHPEELAVGVQELLMHPNKHLPEETPIAELLDQYGFTKLGEEKKPLASSSQPGKFLDYDEDLAASLGVSHGDFVYGTGKDFPDPTDLEWDQLDPEDAQELLEAKKSVAAAVTKVAKDRFLTQLFSDPRALMMSPEQFRQYSQKGEKVFTDLKAKLWQQTLNKVKGKYTKAWKESYDHHFPEVTSQVMSQPVVKVEHALRFSLKTEFVDLKKDNGFVKDDELMTFYHAGDKSNIGTPDNPWKTMGYKVISFSTSPKFINNWAQKFNGGDNYDPYFVPSNYEQAKSPTHYIVHLTAKNPADFRKEADVHRAAEWHKANGMSSLELEAIKQSLRDGNWAMWERPDMWKALDWDAAYMKESVESALNAAVANADQIHFKYVERFEELNYKLSPETKKLYPAYLWDKLPKHMFEVGGKTADEVADAFGYTTGHRMLTELQRFETERGDVPFRKYLMDQIKAETRRRTLEDVGDLTDPNRILEDAQAMFAEPQVVDLLIDQFKALAEAHGLSLDRTQLEQYSVALFEAMPIKKATNLRVFERALSMTSRKVEALLLKGKVLEALKLKQQQIISHYHLIQSHNLVREVRRNDRKWDSWAKHSVNDKVAQPFQDRIHEILARMGRRVARNPVELMNALGDESIEQWIDHMNSTSGTVMQAAPIPPDPTRTSVGEYHGVALMLQSIFKAGGAEKEVELMGRKAELEGFIEEVNANWDRMGRKYNITNLRAKGPIGTASRAAQGTNSWMIQPERVLEALDDDRLDGPMVAAVDRPMQDGMVWKQDTLKEFGKELEGFLKSQPKGWVDSVKVKLDCPFLFDHRPVVSDRGELIRAMLNMGNQGNYTKLLQGYGIDREAWEGYVHRHASNADWKFVQKIWDMHESLWPRIESEYRELVGIAPTKVKLTPVETPFGSIKGGYFPISYDWLQAEIMGMPVPRKVDEENPFGREFVSAFPTNPYTKGRTNYYAPILLNFDTIFGGLSATVHDLAFRRALIQANRILRQPQVKKGIIEVLGPPYQKQLNSWLKYVAHDSLMDDGHASWVANILRQTRVNISNVGLMYRMSVVALHGPIAFFSTMAEAEKLSFLKAITDLYANPSMVETHNFITENSGEIRNRMRNQDRDINDAVKDLILKKGFITEYQKYGFHVLGWSDQFSARAAWLYKYRKELSEMTEPDEAMKRADQFVRQVHGSGSPVNLSGVQRGGLGPHGELGKFSTLFTSFLNHTYNRNWRYARLAKRTVKEAQRGDWDGARRDFSKVMSYALFAIVVPMLWYKFEKGTIQGQKRAQGAHGYTAGLLHNILGGVPLANQALNMIEGMDTSDMILQPLQAMIGTEKRPGVVRDLSRALTGHEDKVSNRWVQHAMETVGYWTGLGLGGPALGVQYMYNLGTGKEHVESFPDFVHGMLFGPASGKGNKGKAHISSE